MKRIFPPDEIGTKHGACTNAAQSFRGDQMPNSQEFRKRAEECHRLAAAVCDPRAKEFWLRSAEDWMKVAAASEKLADRPVQAA
jgi:hypothetical protein